jgi:LacI family transcriptional regulator
MNKNNRPPTIMDVAQAAGVSIATVSRVINGIDKVNESTIQKVQKAVSQLHYSPSATAQGLAKQATFTIGLLLPEISGTFFQAMLSGIETCTSRAGYDLFIQTTQNPLTKDTQRRKLAEHNTDGLLVFAGSLEPEELKRLSDNHFPVVLLFQSPPAGINLPSLTIENISGTRQMIDHLIEVHHRQSILLLRGPKNHEDAHLREQGYRESLQTHAIPFDQALVSEGSFNHQVAHYSMSRVISNGLKFDAVFAGDDDAALGVLLALREAGLRVPEEVSVVGFDDQSFSATIMPPLTTVRAPIQEIGLQAAELLIQVIKGEESNPSGKVFPTELVIRQSCGCPF